MAATQAHDRHPEIAAPVLDLALEARIAVAEQAVIRRDARIRTGFGRIATTARVGPRRFLQRHFGLIAAVAGTGAVLGGILAWRHRRSARPEPGDGESNRTSRTSRRRSLVDVMPVAWRLVPGFVKDQVIHRVRAEFRRFVASISSAAR